MTTKMINLTINEAAFALSKVERDRKAKRSSAASAAELRMLVSEAVSDMRLLGFMG